LDNRSKEVTQTLPLSEQLKALESLQEIDIKIDSLKKNRHALPAQIKAIEDGVAKLKFSVDAKKKSVEDIEKAQRQTQAAQELNKDRLARANSKLEAVANSQEFQAANKEIEQLKKLNTSLDEQTKKANLDIETLGKDTAELTTALEKQQGERDAQTAMLNTEGSKLEKDIASLTSERKQFVSRIEPRVLAQYDRIRGARAGLGIVPAVGGRCKGCNMMVPPQLFIEIQRANLLHQCPSCQRLLYVSVPAGTSTSAST
jgi:predicted  nucleic acid-binding Zn-ribbon protein